MKLQGLWSGEWKYRKTIISINHMRIVRWQNETHDPLNERTNRNDKMMRERHGMLAWQWRRTHWQLLVVNLEFVACLAFGWQIFCFLFIYVFFIFCFFFQNTIKNENHYDSKLELHLIYILKTWFEMIAMMQFEMKMTRSTMEFD